ncbi:hypothetical protein ACFL2Z_05400, partial [Candidatus Eisenbacteria bacterium]
MRRFSIALLLLLVLVSSTTAYASGQLGKRITVYSWLPSFKGTMCVMDSTADIDASFGDISDNMNFPVALNAEYWINRAPIGFYFNFNYIGIEEESISEGNTGITIVKTVDMVFMDFGAGYQFGPFQLGSSPDGPTLGVDILAGGRYVWLQDIVDYRGVDKLKGSSKFVDPVIGGRLRLYPSRNWAVTFKGDIGGGAGADLMWNLLLGANWQFADHWWLNLAYRGFDIDYKPGDDSSNEVGLDA